MSSMRNETGDHSKIGDLESEVLEILKGKQRASAGDIHEVLSGRRQIAYTTVSTTLDRLYKKRLADRVIAPGRGGRKYLYLPGKDMRTKDQTIRETLDRLTQAFGDTAYPAFYKKIEALPDHKLSELKREVSAAKRTGRKGA
jgi:predicted transcriptional regulator